MGESDRLYEAACSVRDLETKNDRLALEVGRLKEQRDALLRGANELVEAILEARMNGSMNALPGPVASAIAGLEALSQP